jgi:hypothetical protein
MKAVPTLLTLGICRGLRQQVAFWFEKQYAHLNLNRKGYVNDF